MYRWKNKISCNFADSIEIFKFMTYEEVRYIDTK